MSAEHARQVSQLANLQTGLSQRLNRSLISGLLEEVDRVSMAVPAVPQRLAQPRQIPLKVATAFVLGGMLGLMIALFRSVGGV